jgi:hypothetical protein
MKADDKQISDRLQEIIELRKKIDERTATVLPLHLILEQKMSEYLQARNEAPPNKWAGKKQRCEELKPPEFEPEMWPVFKACNDLRNEIAHNLDQAAIQARVEQLRAAYLAALSPGVQRKASEGLGDIQIIEDAFRLCHSYMSVATENVKKGK